MQSHHLDSSNDLSMFDGLHDFLPTPATIDNDQINEFGTTGVPDDYTATFANSIFTGPSVTAGSSLSWGLMTATPSMPQILPPSESRTSSSSVPGLQLSKFQQNLTSHLAQLRSTPWDILSTLRLESTPCLTCHQPATDPLLGAAFDPLTSTFRLMTEFERMISDFRTPGINVHITSGAAAAAAAADDYGPQMELSYVLTAVSCYIQLVLIYDCILSHLAEQCANNRIVRDFILLSAMSLSLGGQALPPSRNLLGKSLVRLLESRIGTIEAILGLPDDLRVSRGGRRRRGRGRSLEGEDECGTSVSDRNEGIGLVGNSLLGVLQASLLTSESDAGRPAIMESLRARMTYLEQLA